MPIENTRGYMNSHITPAQLRMNAERDNMSYQSKGGLSKGSRGLPPLNDHYNYQPNNYQSYKIGLSAQYQNKIQPGSVREQGQVSPPIISTHGGARKAHIEQK